MTCFVFLIFYIVTCANAVAHNVDYDGNIFKQVLLKLDGMQAKIDQHELSVANLKHTVTDLSSTVTRLQKHIHRLETSEAKLKRTVRNAVKTDAQLRQQIADLSKTKKEMSEKPEKEISEETYQIVENISANNRIKGDNSERILQKDPIKTGGELTKNGKSISLRRDARQTSEQVAFCAYLDHVIRNLGQNQIIVHNRVLLNEAGAYSTNTGPLLVKGVGEGYWLFSNDLREKPKGPKLYLHTPPPRPVCSFPEQP